MRLLDRLSAWVETWKADRHGTAAAVALWHGLSLTDPLINLSLPLTAVAVLPSQRASPPSSIDVTSVRLIALRQCTALLAYWSTRSRCEEGTDKAEEGKELEEEGRKSAWLKRERLKSI